LTFQLRVADCFRSVFCRSSSFSSFFVIDNLKVQLHEAFVIQKTDQLTLNHELNSFCLEFSAAFLAASLPFQSQGKRKKRRWKKIDMNWRTNKSKCYHLSRML
jgi:hypothetical protein